jgi:hypothetical protein
MDPGRAAALRILANRWVNQTVIRYFIMPSPDTTDEQRQVIRSGFIQWKDIGIGINFREVDRPQDAEIRILINFAKNASNSFMGADNLRIPSLQPTMNFGWDLRTAWGHATVLHEIGHALGLAHEHQNPNAGIVWNEAAVIQSFERNQGWSEQMIRDNIINALPPTDIEGTTWDVRSIMHYPFAAGLLQRPPPFDVQGTPRNFELSPRDIAYVKSIYPIPQSAPMNLSPMSLQTLSLTPGQQADFEIIPDATRKYKIQTVGKSDSRLVLFEDRDGEPHYVCADDDSGTDDNSTLEVPLVRGRKYHLRVRLNYLYGPGAGGFGVMMV